jgi:hypothetical protein
MSRSIWLVILLLAGTLVALAVQAQQGTVQDSLKPQTGQTAAPVVKPDSSAATDIFIASYFHGDVRCPTCIKLESYSGEALQTGFEKELKDSALIWRSVNWDQEENKHYVDDYKLFTKALILSRVRDGKEVAWVNLDSIWTLVGDKELYIKYVQDQTRAFIATPVK